MPTLPPLQQDKHTCRPRSCSHYRCQVWWLPTFSDITSIKAFCVSHFKTFRCWCHLQTERSSAKMLSCCEGNICTNTGRWEWGLVACMYWKNLIGVMPSHYGFWTRSLSGIRGDMGSPWCSDVDANTGE